MAAFCVLISTTAVLTKSPPYPAKANLSHGNYLQILKELICNLNHTADYHNFSAWQDSLHCSY